MAQVQQAEALSIETVELAKAEGWSERGGHVSSTS
jgi:hypothetical protein